MILETYIPDLRNAGMRSHAGAWERGASFQNDGFQYRMTIVPNINK